LLYDDGVLGPLLSAYDSRIAQLDSDLNSRTQQSAELRRQVDEIVDENERLRDELAKAIEARQLALSAAALSAIPEPGSLTAEEADLLRQENELLLQQQRDGEEEMHRLRKRLDDKSQEALRAGQDYASMLSQLSQTQAQARDAEEKLSRQISLTANSEARVAALMDDLSESRVAAAAAEEKHSSTLSAAEEKHSTALAAAEERLAAALREADTHRQLTHDTQDELQAMQAKYRESLDAQTAVRNELTAAKERHEELSNELKDRSHEVDTLRRGMALVEAKLADYQRKDAEMYKRIREALEAAEESRASRDATAARCAELEQQLQLANAHLSSVRQTTRETVLEEVAAQQAALQAALQATAADLAASQAAVSDWRAKTERLERDVRGHLAEIAVLKEDAANALSSKNRLGLATMGALEKVTHVERERDEALARLDQATRRLERNAQEALIEKTTLEQALRNLKLVAAEREGDIGMLKGEVAVLKRQAESLDKDLVTLRASKVAAEADLRRQIAIVTAERDGEVKALSAKLEASAAASAASAQELSRFMQSKQEMLSKWREEALSVTTKLNKAVEEHRAQAAAAAVEQKNLAQQNEALVAENAHLNAWAQNVEAELKRAEAEVKRAEAEAKKWEGEVKKWEEEAKQWEREAERLEAAAAAELQNWQSGAAAAAAEAAAAQEEVKRLEAALVKVNAEKTRLENQRYTADPMTARYDALKREIKSALYSSTSSATAAAAAAAAAGAGANAAYTPVAMAERFGAQGLIPAHVVGGGGLGAREMMGREVGGVRGGGVGGGGRS